MKHLTILALLLLFSFVALYAQTPGNALRFGITHADEIVEANGTGTTNTDEITLEAWVKWGGTAGGNQIIAYNGLDATNGYGIGLNSEDTEHPYSIGLLLNTMPFQNSTSTLTPGVWTHVAAVRNSGNWKIYLNGNATSLSSSIAPIAPSTYLKIGNNTNTWWGFVGIIDEVRLSTVARYTNNFTPSKVPFSSDASTATLYHFDESSGQTVIDATGGNNGHLGTTTGEENEAPDRVVSDAPLPVLLYSFSAKLVNNKIELKWQTSPLSEVETFEIQRFDGRMWQKADLIEAHPQSGDFQEFLWTDDISTLSKDLTEISYRIKYTDLTGNTAYSQTQTVNVKKPTSIWLAQNFPNPFNPGTTISYAITEPADVKLIVFNSLGEQIETLVNGYQSENIYTVTFDASHLPNGLYFYKLLVNNRFVDMKKMLVLK
ncbi:T9SS type A sorting domain-containing protein [candidate division KSB1 bacterium]|nr:T9SS type A sorting domain-containing protein [candidate division KSB1 bacterium]